MEQIEKTIFYLRQGGVILYPTDTIWGLGCDMNNPQAIKKILTLKCRSNTKGLILLIDDFEKLTLYIKKIPSKLNNMIKEFAQPVTVVFDSPSTFLPKELLLNGKVAIRITKSYFCKQLISKFGSPVISTSANISGEKAPTNLLSSVSEEIKKKVDFIANEMDQSGTGLASAIVEISCNNQINLLRP